MSGAFIPRCHRPPPDAILDRKLVPNCPASGADRCINDCIEWCRKGNRLSSEVVRFIPRVELDILLCAIISNLDRGGVFAGTKVSASVSGPGPVGALIGPSSGVLSTGTRTLLRFQVCIACALLYGCTMAGCSDSSETSSTGTAPPAMLTGKELGLYILTSSCTVYSGAGAVVSVENIDLCFGLAGLKLPDWAHFGAPNMAEALRRSRETLGPLVPDCEE